MKPFLLVGIMVVMAGLAGNRPRPGAAAEDFHMAVAVVADSAGLADHYRVHITTPVCEDDKCYIVHIIFYWDLIGRFMAYDTLPGQGLTKLDHIPFTQEDYAKLDQLLQDAHSPLAAYAKADLVRETRSSEIDGLTGATAQEIKASVISGGVYSCYTLWHIAHGSRAVDSLQRQTATLLDEALVTKLVAKQDQAINYFLLESFSEADFARYLPQLLHTIAQGQGYYAKNAIERIPRDVLADSRAQAFFARQYAGFNYFAQVALLKKMDPHAMTDAMADTLQHHLVQGRHSAQNDLIQRLLDDRQAHIHPEK